MKINFATEVCDLDGKAVTENDLTLTLKSIAVNALLLTLTGENGQPEQLSGENKVCHALLAQRIYSEENIDLTAEEIVLLKTRIGSIYSPLVVMQAWNALDPTLEKSNKA